MKLMTYLAFTLLSVILQFAVLGLIQSNQKLLGNQSIDLNSSSQKKQFHDVLKDLSDRPHALFYRTKTNAMIKNNISTKMYSNSSLTDMSLQTTNTTNIPSTISVKTSTTDIPSTITDLFYDENSSNPTTEDVSTSTESVITTEIEYDNVTEITLFENKNTSIVKPKPAPKKTTVKDCQCNLLYEVCDINCCCDSDCTEMQLKMFTCFGQPKADVHCDVHYSITSYLMGSGVENLFCIAKTNLPDRRIVTIVKHDPSIESKSLKWHEHPKKESVQLFDKQFYKYGDPIWVLRNGSVYYIDLPSKSTNNYCSNRKPIKFLKNERINCNVKLADMEIFQIQSTSDYESVISVTEKSLNTSALNCTNLHCANWTIIVCNDNACAKYDNEIHEPSCSESVCSNLALRVDYLFYYYDSKITNVTIKLYNHVSLSHMPFFAQEVNVNFLLANTSFDNIISLSGNPGYITGLPVIVSYSEGNYTDGFYNESLKRKYLPFPQNLKGFCTKPSLTKEFVLFGINKQVKCRYAYVHKTGVQNATNLCRNIQSQIQLLLGLNDKIMISPVGNPCNMKDAEWIKLSHTSESPVFGEFNKQKTKLLCYDFIVRFSFVFTYADASEIEGRNENKILSASLVTAQRNVTFKTEDISLVVTVDSVFIDESRPSVYEYAAAPQLNIHLPKDFFFPFPNNSCIFKCNVLVTLCACFLSFISK